MVNIISKFFERDAKTVQKSALSADKAIWDSVSLIGLRQTAWAMVRIIEILRPLEAETPARAPPTTTQSGSGNLVQASEPHSFEPGLPRASRGHCVGPVFPGTKAQAQPVVRAVRNRHGAIARGPLPPGR